MTVKWLCGLLSIASVVRAEEVTFTRAYEMAVEQSERLQISVAEWRAAEARYRQALGALWPEVTAKGESSWTDEDNYRRAGFGAKWTVFDGFRNTRLADARRADGVARYHDAEYLRLLLYLDVADVFYQVLSFQDQRTASREELKALEKRATELEHRIKLGLSKRSDLLLTLNQIAESRLTIEQLNQFHAATLELLAFVTGQPASNLQVVDRTPLPAIGDVDKYLASATDRDDIKAREASVAAARSSLGAAQSDRTPKVTADGNAYPLRDPQDTGEWDLILRVELPVFDGGIRRARVDEAGQQLKISELRMAELRRSSQRDVRQAYESLFYELRQWSELQTGIKVATETLELFQKDYKLGRVNNLDVLTALVQFWGLRRRDAALGHQLRAEIIHLHVAAGKASQ